MRTRPPAPRHRGALVAAAVCVALAGCAVVGAPGGPAVEVALPAASPAPAPAPARVALFGDSLAEEASPYTLWMLQASGRVELRQHTFGGSAPCDWTAPMQATLDAWRPDVVVMAFTGNALTPCMQQARTGSAYAEKYLADARAWAGAATAAGARIVFVSPPATRTARGLGHPVQRAYSAVAAELGEAASWTYGGTDLSPGDTYRDRLPCGPGDGCESGEVQVRNADGVHLCPLPTPPAPGSTCAVDSPGARRYATTISDAVLAAVDAVRRSR